MILSAKFFTGWGPKVKSRVSEKRVFEERLMRQAKNVFSILKLDVVIIPQFSTIVLAVLHGFGLRGVQRSCTKHSIWARWKDIQYMEIDPELTWSRVSGRITLQTRWYPDRYNHLLLPDASRRQQRVADAIRRSLGAKRLTTSEFTWQNLFMIPIGLMPRFAGDPQRVRCPSSPWKVEY